MNKRELIKKIAGMAGTTRNATTDIVNALDAEGWLRDPDQAPGPAITRSESMAAHRLVDHIEDDLERAEAYAEELGIKITPDPEPTNAQKWESFIRASDFKVRGFVGNDATKAFAELLDAADAKAPEGEES